MAQRSDGTPRAAASKKASPFLVDFAPVKRRWIIVGGDDDEESTTLFVIVQGEDGKSYRKKVRVPLYVEGATLHVGVPEVTPA